MGDPRDEPDYAAVIDARADAWESQAELRAQDLFEDYLDRIGERE